MQAFEIVLKYRSEIGWVGVFLCEMLVEQYRSKSYDDPKDAMTDVLSWIEGRKKR